MSYSSTAESDVLPEIAFRQSSLLGKGRKATKVVE
jgi:hypothetical protein